MPSENRLNPGKGKWFQELAAQLLSEHFGVQFELDYPLTIGNPPKEHRFDLVSSDLRYVGECKNYAWTKAGNVPSAKMAFVNEAVLYLSFLSKDIVRCEPTAHRLGPGRQRTVEVWDICTDSIT